MIRRRPLEVRGAPSRRGEVKGEKTGVGGGGGGGGFGMKFET